MKNVIRRLPLIFLLVVVMTCRNPTLASSDREILSLAFLAVDNPFLDEPAPGSSDSYAAGLGDLNGR